MTLTELDDLKPLNPGTINDGPLLVISPHFDDEIIGCGHLLAGLPDKDAVHVAFCTLGDHLPAGIRLAENGAVAGSISDQRREESRKALSVTGIHPDNLHYFDSPELALNVNLERLAEWFDTLDRHLSPVSVFIPGRFDQHPDHLAARRAWMMQENKAGDTRRIYEYFIYADYPLLPGRDIRRYFKAPALRMVKGDQALKMRALEKFESQNSLFFKGQTKPVLSSSFMAKCAEMPEYFVDAKARDDEILRIPAWLPAVLQMLQPRLKRAKEFLRARLGIN